MKKIVMGMAAVAMAASIFAVDFAAHVEADGDIAKGTITTGDNSSYTLGAFAFQDNDQKDADLLEVAFTGDKAGAAFKFNGLSSGSALNVRAIKTWFKPVEQLTISVGNVGLYLYTERVNWWKVPTGNHVDNGWEEYGPYSSASGLKESGGFTAELNLDVLNGLYIGAGVAPGFGGGTWFSAEKGKDASLLAYGAVAKLQITDTVSAGIAWRDDGTNAPKWLTVGADFGNWGTPYYGFLQGRVLFDDNSVACSWAQYKGWGYWDNDLNQWFGSDSDEFKAKYPEESGFNSKADAKGMALRGIVIDNYFSYNFGAVKLEATIPVTIRGFADKEANDPSYMTARIKVTAPLDACTVGIVVGSNEGLNETGSSDANGFWTLDKNFGDNFTFYANPYVSFNVGSAAISVGAEVGAKPKANKVVWALPFTTSVSF